MPEEEVKNFLTGFAIFAFLVLIGFIVTVLVGLLSTPLFILLGHPDVPLPLRAILTGAVATASAITGAVMYDVGKEYRREKFLQTK